MQAQAVRSLRLIGQRPTLDLRVDHDDHNFLAEGIVVSNSHAVEYAYLTAACVYFKARYPQAFYITALKLASEEPNPIAYMNAVIAEMRATGIQLLPPDLLKSEADFSIQDGHVRFGLSHIKGVSVATMTKIASFKRDFQSKFDIFEAAKAAKIDIRTMTALIYCGCLDSVIMDGSSRAKFALEAQLYNLLTDNEKRLAKRFQDEFRGDLLALVKALPDKHNEKGKPLVRASRLDTLRRDYIPYWDDYQANSRVEDLSCYLHERRLLGFSASSSLHACYVKRVPTLTPLKAVPTSEERPTRFVAFVGDAKMCVSGKGDPYWRAELFDDEAKQLCMIHGEEKLDACKHRNGDLPKAGDIVIAVGSPSKDGRMFFIDSLVKQIDPTKKQEVPVLAPTAITTSI